MKRVNIFVEGQSEETFVRDVLEEHFLRLEIFLNPILVRTSKSGKGGITTYGKIKDQITRKCLHDKTAFVTTLFDYYGLPKDFPGRNDLPKTDDPIEKAIHLEKAFMTSISQPNFIPNLMVHEYEALLYTQPEAFEEWFDTGVVESLIEIREAFQTSEHINNDPQTAPSKRILKLCSGYKKVLHGSLIAIDIGLDTMRQDCHHFNSWLKCLEGL